MKQLVFCSEGIWHIEGKQRECTDTVDEKTSFGPLRELGARFEFSSCFLASGRMAMNGDVVSLNELIETIQFSPAPMAN